MSLKDIYFNNSIESWFISFCVALALYFLFIWLKSIVVNRLERISKGTSTGLDDFAVSMLSRTKKLTLFALAIFVGSMSLNLADGLLRFLYPALLFVGFYQVWVWGNQSLCFLVEKLLSKDKDLRNSDDAIAGTMPAILFLGRVALLSLILILALDNLGFDITALVASLGVGGIAIALAVQNILGDLFASLSIVLDKPFKVGDFIVVDDLSGNVEKIGLKTTRVRSLSGEQLIFSNNDLLSSRVRNYKKMMERRIIFQIGVIYQTSKEQLERIPEMIKEIIDEIELARFDRAHFSSFGASSLDFEIVYFVLSPDFPVYRDVQHEINLKLFQRFEENDIEFAYPTQSIFFQKAVSNED